MFGGGTFFNSQISSMGKLLREIQLVERPAGHERTCDCLVAFQIASFLEYPFFCPNAVEVAVVGEFDS